MESFNKVETQQQLEQLSARHRVAFAAAVGERLYPNYVIFSEQQGWGNPQLLRSALDVVWKFSAGEEIAEHNLQQLREKLYNIIPSADDFPAAITSAAIDAASAIYEALGVCIDGSAHRAADIAGFAYDTIHMYVQERDDLNYSDPSFDDHIHSDPLMVLELERQRADIDLLRRTTLSQEALDELRRHSRSNKPIYTR